MYVYVFRDNFLFKKKFFLRQWEESYVTALFSCPSSLPYVTALFPCHSTLPVSQLSSHCVTALFPLCHSFLPIAGG